MIDQVGVRRCKFCLLPAKLNFNVFYKPLFVILLWMIVFPQSWFGVKANIGKKMNYVKVYLKNEIPVFHDVELNDSSIVKELIADSCVLPSIAIAQAHIESSFYKSEKTFKNKNIFGIKPHKCKYVTGEYNYQATYNSYKDCIACYCHIQKFYLKNIDGHYAQSKAYVGLIKQVQ